MSSILVGTTINFGTTEDYSTKPAYFIGGFCFKLLSDLKPGIVMIREVSNAQWE